VRLDGRKAGENRSKEVESARYEAKKHGSHALRESGATTHPPRQSKNELFSASLKVGKRTLYRLAAHGEIPAFKVGGTWRFRQSEIDRWINDQIQAGRKKEVIRTDEQPKSAEHSVSSGRAVRRRRQTE